MFAIGSPCTMDKYGCTGDLVLPYCIYFLFSLLKAPIYVLLVTYASVIALEPYG